MAADWEAVIGLETHVQLGTESKIFTAASTAFGDDPNTHIDPVVCGLPGTLPVLNKKVLEYAVKAALALNLEMPSTASSTASSTSIPICRRTIRSPSSMSPSPKTAGSRWKCRERQGHLPEAHRH